MLLSLAFAAILVPKVVFKEKTIKLTLTVLFVVRVLAAYIFIM